MTGERLRLISWRPLRQGRVRGFASVEVFGCLTIRDCPLLVDDQGRVWASLPAKPELDRTGHCRTGTRGERLYTEIISWKSRRLKDAFSERLVSLVRAAHPDDLD
jgi:hypothetical protein